MKAYDVPTEFMNPELSDDKALDLLNEDCEDPEILDAANNHGQRDYDDNELEAYEIRKRERIALLQEY